MVTWTKSSLNSQIPKQYLKGWLEFYKLKFKVDSRVLIPRPETELLVDEVLKFFEPNQTILDIGTGSGNIAISLAKNLKRTKIFAVDVSDDALDLAKENAKLNKVSDKIFFLQSDLLSSFRDSSLITLHSSLIIVTNLPYIPRGRMPYLDASVRDFEPWIALVGGSDGFDLYRKLFQQIKEKNLVPKLLIAEIDYTHGELAIIEAKKYFPKATVEVKTDLTQNIRILLIHF